MTKKNSHDVLTEEISEKGADFVTFIGFLTILASIMFALGFAMVAGARFANSLFN